MKTLKPGKISVLWKTFELDHKVYFTVTLLVFCDLAESASFHSEVDLWKFAASELGSNVMLDECMPKKRGEVLVNGRCFAPGGAPVPGWQVRLTMGTVDKTLYVFGDRVWEWTGAMSHPAPFTEMPVAWETAFGGEGFDRNPIGTGMPVKKDGEPHRLPNVEDPKNLIKSRGDRPAPVCFAPVDLTWPQRWSKIGHYDMTWVKEQAPGFALDIDLSMFNAAPPDQQIDGYFRGDEAYSIENMHPDRPRLEGRLPAVKGRCFITRKPKPKAPADPAGEPEVVAPPEMEEIEAHLDTVRFFPHAERVVLAFRSLTHVVEDDAADVLDLMVALEDMNEPKPIEHYRKVRSLRLDPRNGALHALRESDLLPPRAVTRKKDRQLDPNDVEALVATEGLLRKNLAARAKLEADKTRAAITAAGGNPDDYDLPELPPETEIPELEGMADFVERTEAMVEQQRKDAEQQRAIAEQRARASYAAAGLDYDTVTAQAKKDTTGPPKFSADKEMQRLRDLKQLAQNGGVETPQLDLALADEELRKSLEKAERELIDAYRKYAHFMPAAARLEGSEDDVVRERVVRAYAGAESFVGCDLTGANLSGLDLAFANFQGAFLEAADLKGAKLTEADFTGAVLTRADLSGADLSKAKLTEANLGQARLAGANLGDGADLERAVLMQADLSGADLRRANLHKADLAEAKLAGADVRGADVSDALFLRNDLSGARFGEADLQHACFIEADLTGVDFTSAKLGGTTFVTVKADRTVFVNASLDNARIVHDSTFEGADFRGATANKTNFRGTKLAGADFSTATLNQSDFSECDMRGAKFYRAIAKSAMFMRTDLTDATMVGANLLEAIFQKATLHGVNFTGSNLFRADLAKSAGDSRTSFERANVKHVRVVAKPEQGQP